MATKLNASGQPVFLDVLVLVAMAITAAAFAAGLIVNSGVDLVPGLIAGAALYMVMASAHFVITRSARSGAVSGRLDQLEEALLILDADLQRIDQVEDDVARLDLLTDRVERLDQAVVGHDGNGDAAGRAQVDRLTADFEDLHARLEALRADLEGEARSQRDKISTELRSLEGLIKQLSRELTAAPAATSAGEAYRAQVYAPPVLSAAEEEAEAALAADEAAHDTAIETLTLTEADQTVDLDSDDETADDALLTSVRDAIERTRIDVYLQPVMTMPDRKPRYYEALTRLRTLDNEVILPASFLPLAESANLMPLVDNVMLVKSVQVLRRLGPESKVKGMFCNISVQSLLDADFFPELVEFMEENSSLNDCLFFELGQGAILGLAPDELEHIDALGKLGFRFSLGHVTDLDIDLAALRDHYFRFVKIEARTLLQDLDEQGVHDFAADLRRFDLELIVEKAEDEASLHRLAALGMGLVSGNALSEPRPFTSELIRELEDADAA